MTRQHLSVLRSLVLAICLFFVATAGEAAIILDTGMVDFLGTDTQFGRLSRDGVPSDWATPKDFPGAIGAPAARSYETFTVNSDIYSFIQIQLDDPASVLFVSAYLGSYTPVNVGPNYGLDVNYLGDAGLSQPFGNPSFFQIAVAPFTQIVIPINELNPGSGLGAGFQLLVEGFLDTDYNDEPTTTVPEPSSAILLGMAAAVVLAKGRRRRIA
jgi:hypothetical protein